MMTEERKKVIWNVQYPKIGPKVSRNLVKILKKGHGKSSWILCNYRQKEQIMETIFKAKIGVMLKLTTF